MISERYRYEAAARQPAVYTAANQGIGQTVARGAGGEGDWSVAVGGLKDFKPCTAVKHRRSTIVFDQSIPTAIGQGVDFKNFHLAGPIRW